MPGVHLVDVLPVDKPAPLTRTRGQLDPEHLGNIKKRFLKKLKTK